MPKCAVLRGHLEPPVSTLIEASEMHGRTAVKTDGLGGEDDGRTDGAVG